MNTILLILVDESLSMRTRKNEVIDGINSFLEVQRNNVVEGGCRLVLIKFNNNVTVMHRGECRRCYFADVIAHRSHRV